MDIEACSIVIVNRITEARIKADLGRIKSGMCVPVRDSRSIIYCQRKAPRSCLIWSYEPGGETDRQTVNDVVISMHIGIYVHI